MSFGNPSAEFKLWFQNALANSVELVYGIVLEPDDSDEHSPAFMSNPLLEIGL